LIPVRQKQLGRLSPLSFKKRLVWCRTGGVGGEFVFRASKVEVHVYTNDLKMRILNRNMFDELERI
jgi:hypothetical protein